MEFQVISWDARDDADSKKFMIHMFGRTEDGKSVHVATHFKPYFFVKGRVPGRPQVKCKDLWGFQNLQEHMFSMLEFESLEEFRDEQRKYRNNLYEANIDPLLRFMHRSGIKSTGWATFPNDLESSLMTDCDVDVFVSNWKLIKPIDRDDFAPFRIASVDIECYSESGQFPDSLKKSDTCFQIAVTTKAGGEYIDKRVFGVKTEFNSEKEMLEAFVEYLKKLDPDVITGWNIFGFDLEYIYNRMVLTGCTDFALGRLLDNDVELTVKNLSSNALGNNTLKMVKMTGRYIFDMYQEIKREHKFESYSLNNVSKILLGDQKLDMPVKEIFGRYASGEGLEEVAEYCIKDTELPHAISEKLSLFQNLVEMAKACWVPLNFLSERGQQIKVFSQLAYTARELGFMIPTIRNREHVEGGYQGATVLEAQTGAYYEPITALDFASLYPSIMCAHRLCYSTYVMDKRYLDLPGVTYERFGPHVFAVEKDGKPVDCLLPIILERLKVYRKEAKKKMETCSSDLYNVYNGKQLAYKISMNSVYGFTGAVNRGMLPLMAIAETVTMRGRQMIEQSKEYVESNFKGAKVRYGDSVMPGTPVLVRDGSGNVSVQTIENIAKKWEEYPGFLKEGSDKEQSELSGTEAWTHDGWKSVRRVIRHKCQKKIWRVVTHTGVVDVTEDHSLLNPDLVHVKPKDVTRGTELLHSFPLESVHARPCDYTDDELFVFGVFVGDGSCGLYECTSGKKASWAINNKDVALLEKCKEILEKMYPENFTFVIMDTLESSGVYKLSPRGSHVKKLVEEWRDLCYDGKSKKVPEFAMKRKGFLDGLWASDGCRKDYCTIGCHRIDTKNQVTAQWYYMYLCSIGYNVSLNTRNDKPDVFRLTWSLSNFRKNAHAVKKIHVLHDSWDGYVYDLETEAGTFQAGVGSLIVKNTDSIMVQFDTGGLIGQDAVEYSWKLGERASKEISALFKSPNKLELEKVYCPYFLYSKKRYAAKMWVEKKGKVVFDKIDVKGLQVVRRDSCKFVRDTCKGLLETVLESPDPAAAVRMAREAKEQLITGKVEMENLILTKSLASDYKVQMPHVEVVKKMRQRNPGSEPQVGSRVPFVVIKAKGERLFEKAEDPVWVSENNIPLDYEYYFEHQLKKPVEDLLEPLISASDVFSTQKKSRKITEFFFSANSKKQ
jgi:DNA polymerase delta subunit 1